MEGSTNNTNNFNDKSKSLGDIFSALTIAVLFVVILLLVVFNAVSYQHGATYQSENDSTRVVCAYIASSVKDNNGGQVTPMDFDGSPCILIEDGDTGFAQKIYAKDGDLLEEYSMTETNINPQTASKIGETSQFEVSYVRDDLLEIKTDKGASYVHVEK